VFPGAKAGCFTELGFTEICFIEMVTACVAQNPTMGRARPWDTEVGATFRERTARSTLDVYVVLMSIRFATSLRVRAPAFRHSPRSRT
jgi:hypothetical protein